MNTKQLLFGAVACLFYIGSPSQTTYNTWLRGNFSQPNNSRSCISADGQQVLAADYMIGANRQISLTKVDVNGFEKWSYTYGDPGNEVVAGICLANDGGFLVSGSTTSYSGTINDIFVLKTDSVGTVLWYKTFNNGFQHSPRTVAQTTNGNICVAGCYEVWSFAGQPMAATILMLDATGNFLSFQALDFGRNYPYFLMAQATPAGGFILTGQFGHTWDYYAVLAAQLDGAGTVQWINAYRSTTPSGIFNLWTAGNRTSSSGYCAKPVATGYLIGGYISDHDQYGTNATFHDALLLSVDVNGNLLWTGQYPNGIVSDVNDVAETITGQFSAAGYNQSGADAFQYMLQTNGTIISSRAFGTSPGDQFFSMNSDSGGDLLLSGKTDAPGFPANWLVRTDASGTNSCQNTALPVNPLQPVYVIIPPVYTITTAITPSTHALTKNCACVKSEFFCPVTIPPVDFTHDSACANSPVTFNNLSNVYMYCPPTIVWDFGDGTYSSVWDTTHTYNNTGNYIVNLYIIDCFNDTLSAQHTVNIGSSFTVDLGSDTTICASSILTLDAGNPGYSYTWNTSQNSQTITVSNGGWYSVSVSDGSCSADDSILVSILTAPELGGLITNCEGNAITLDAGLPGLDYLWSTGESTQSIIVSTSGTYWVTIGIGNCILSDTVQVQGGIGEGALYFPNAFTPDDNGVNEIFTGVGNSITSFQLDIWNRWGELIYSTDDIIAGWNGQYKGKLVQNDVYVYVATYTTSCTGEAPLRKVGHVWVGL